MPSAYRPSREWLFRFTLVGLAYYLGGRLGLSFPYVGSHITLIWPATGIALAALLRWGPSLWPAVWAGAFAVNLAVGGGVALAFGVACGNALGPWLAAHLLRRLEFNTELVRRRDLLRYLVIAVLGGMAITATSGVAQLALNGLLRPGEMIDAWVTWWLGDAMGALVLGIPLLSTSRRYWQRVFRGRRGLELAAVLFVTLAVGAVVFPGHAAASPANPGLYVPFLLLCWLGIRGGAGIASTAAALLAALAIWATAGGSGPFLAGDARSSLAMLWGYMATATIIAILIAVLVGELLQSERQLTMAMVGAQMGLWDWDIRADRMSYSGDFDGIQGIDPARVGPSKADWVAAAHPDDRLEIERRLAAHLSGATELFEVEYRVQAGEGRWAWVLSRGQVVERDGDGAPTRATGTLLNIDDRKRGQAALEESQARLRQSEERYRLLLNNSPVGILHYDTDLIVTYSNQRFEQIMRVPQGYMLGLDCKRLRDASVLPAMRQAVAGEITHYDGQYVTTYGQVELWISMTCAPVVSEGGEILGGIVVLEDISERKRAESELRLAASVFSHAHEGILICDADKVVVDVNPTFTEITGYARAEVVGRTPGFLGSGRHDEAFYRAMWESIESDGYWDGEVWNRRKDGSGLVERLSISTVRDGRGRITHYIGTFSDITVVKEQQTRLEQLAHYDPLTRLPNRALLADRMAQALAQARRNGTLVAVCYLDLDGFKAINDQLGHDAGDTLLVEVARRLTETVRAGDTVARLGGDEFVLLLVGLKNVEECHRAMSRLLGVIATPLRIKAHERCVSGSIGVALYPDDASDADALIRHADQAMYIAKQAGKNRYELYDRAQDEQVRGRREALERVRCALAGDELRLHYQPIVDMHRGEVVGMEGLIRWEHPDRGLLMPAEFLPLVQGSEVEAELGLWVLAEGIRELAAWRSMGVTANLSLNVSAAQLLAPGFVEEAATHLASHSGVERGALQLEIKEAAVLKGGEEMVEAFHRCREAGIEIALDDFGKGYSTLSYFRRMLVGTLKIDRAFVQTALDNAEDLAVVDSVIGLTHAFDRKLVAKGVETPELGMLLLSLGCDTGQGYGIAPPMPGDAVPEWIAGFVPDPAWATRRSSYARQDIPLLTAELDHRTWVRQLEAWLGAEPGTVPPPLLDTSDCRFGQWYSGDGSRRYGSFACFPAVGEVHEAVHRLAQELARLRDEGRHDEARARLAELGVLRDRLIRELAALRAEIAKAEGSLAIPA